MKARNFNEHHDAQPVAGVLKAGLSTYKKTRNALEGPICLVDFPPGWPTDVCQSGGPGDTLEYEESYGANESTYWLRFELLWREFFRWYSRHMGPALFTKKGKNDVCRVNQSESVLFEKWCSEQHRHRHYDAACVS